MIEVLLSAAGGCLILGAGYFSGRLSKPDSKIETVTKSEFDCPYCKIHVSGQRELDLINHIGCIGKSEADLEAEKKKREENTAHQPKYRVTITQETSTKVPPASQKDQWEKDYDTNLWVRYKWTAWRNNAALDSGYDWDKDDAKDAADCRIALDKERFTVYEVD